MCASVVLKCWKFWRESVETVGCRYYHPSRNIGFLVCLPVGFVVNTVVTGGGSAIL